MHHAPFRICNAWPFDFTLTRFLLAGVICNSLAAAMSCLKAALAGPLYGLVWGKPAGLFTTRPPVSVTLRNACRHVAHAVQYAETIARSLSTGGRPSAVSAATIRSH